jgi:hypothetical protein
MILLNCLSSIINLTPREKTTLETISQFHVYEHLKKREMNHSRNITSGHPQVLSTAVQKSKTGSRLGFNSTTHSSSVQAEASFPTDTQHNILTRFANKIRELFYGKDVTYRAVYNFEQCVQNVADAIKQSTFEQEAFLLLSSLSLDNCLLSYSYYGASVTILLDKDFVMMDYHKQSFLSYKANTKLIIIETLENGRKTRKCIVDIATDDIEAVRKFFGATSEITPFSLNLVTERRAISDIGTIGIRKRKGNYWLDRFEAASSTTPSDGVNNTTFISMNKP